MTDGATLNQAAAQKALESKGLKLVSFESTQTTVPAATYHLKASGTG